MSQRVKGCRNEFKGYCHVSIIIHYKTQLRDVAHKAVTFHYTLSPETLRPLYLHIIFHSKDIKMVRSFFLLLASIYARAALGGALKVIDFDRQCVIWSGDNSGCCMGLSASFGLLDGDNCSGE